MQSDQLFSIGADSSPATSLSLSIYNLLLYGRALYIGYNSQYESNMISVCGGEVDLEGGRHAPRVRVHGRRGLHCQAGTCPPNQFFSISRSPVGHSLPF